MLNALSHYLQHLPLMSSEAAKEAVATQEIKNSDKKSTTANTADGYEPSTRAVLVSATANDFDVRSLKDNDIAALQQRLQQYGLIGGRDLDAFAALNTARHELGENASLDAVSIVDAVRSQFSERNTPYSERQQVTRLSTLLHNLDSARLRY